MRRWLAHLDSSPVMWTFGKSQKVMNLRRDDRATLLVEDGEEYQELRGVQLVGHLELVEDQPTVARIGTAIFARQTGTDLGEQIPDIVAMQAPKRVGLRMVIDQTASWDHRKLGRGYE